MPNHKRTARSERLFIDGSEVPAGNSGVPTKATGFLNLADGEDEDPYSNGNDSGSGDLNNHNTGATTRLFESSGSVDAQTVYRNLWLFVWLKTIGSFDSGAFSAALGAENGIGNSWTLTMTAQGVLTSSVFLGNVLGCPLAGYLFSHYSEKRVLCCALVIHTVFTFFFAAIPEYGAALVNRFFVGLTLSFIVVYTPVWVDEFAPKNRQSVWMASHNAGVPLGIMFGYLLAVGPQLFLPQIGWNWSFFIKCVLMVPTIVYVARVDSRTINTIKSTGGSDGAFSGAVVDGEGRAGDRESSGASGGDANAAAIGVSPTSLLSNAQEVMVGYLRVPVGDFPVLAFTRVRHVLRTVFSSLERSFSSSMKPLVTNVVYMCSVISLTSLYFVATGLQNFVTQYLLEPPFEAPMATIMIGFGSAVVTAPVCGVIAGGVLLDRIGGYKDNLWRVTLFVLTWGTGAVFFSILCIFADTTRSFLLVMSAVLFCGGALIPPGAGLTMASLPDHLRSTGAAFSQTVYNLLGNFSGPMVCGWVADVTGQLRYGIITLLLSSMFGVVPVLGILMVAYRGDGAPSSAGGAGADAGANGGRGGTEAGKTEVAVLTDEIHEMQDTSEATKGLPDEEKRLNINGGGGDGATERRDAPKVPQSLVGFTVDDDSSHGHASRTTAVHRTKQFSAPLPTFVPQAEEAVMNVDANAEAVVAAAHNCQRTPAPGPHLGHDSIPDEEKKVGSLLLPSKSAATNLSSSEDNGVVVKDAPAAVPTEASLSTKAAAAPVTPAASSLSNTVKTWAAGRANATPQLHDPGNVHPVQVPVSPPLARTVPVSAASSMRDTPAVSDPELLKLEAEAAQVATLTNQQAYGMDLVRSWLSRQAREELTPASAPSPSIIRPNTMNSTSDA